MPHSEGVSAPTEADRHHRRTVHIYIDRIEKTSPDPTTGVALYALGSVSDTYVLFREVQGRRDDELVPRTDAPLRLTEWEHFYSAQAKLNPGSAA
jgi:hypothetical protein